MKKIYYKLKSKTGNVVIILFGVMMCMFLPIMAAIYDLGMIRMYQQDVKNLQEVAGLACVGVSRGYLNKGGAGSALGGFDEAKCKAIIQQVVASNLGMSGSNGIGNNHHNDELRQLRLSGPSRLKPCGNATTINPEANPDNNMRLVVQVKGLCYKPLFLNGKLLNFQISSRNPYRIQDPKYANEYEIKVQPSVMSAVYVSHEH